MNTREVMQWWTMVCFYCLANSMMNFHAHKNGEISIDCFNCGRSQRYIPIGGRKTTKKEYLKAWGKQQTKIERIKN